MKFFKKLQGLLLATMLLASGASHAYTINGNLDVYGNIKGGIRNIGAATDLTLTIASGVLTIQCGNAACSATNAGYITLPSTTAGQEVTYRITSSPTFGDSTAGDSDFVGTGTCSWGTTAAVAWANDLPILIGFTHDGTTPVAVMARGPVADTGAASNIGYQDVCPSAASQNNVIAMTSTNVTTSHASKPVVWIGAIRIQKNGSDNWTYTALDRNDGIGKFYNFGSRLFTFPTGQMGATSGKYLQDNGGTAPTFTNVNLAQYTQDLDGYFDYAVRLQNAAGGTAGAGAVQAKLAAPLTTAYGGSNMFPQTSVYLKSTAVIDTFGQVAFQDGTSFGTFSYVATVKTAINSLNNADFSGVTREIAFSVRVKAF